MQIGDCAEKTCIGGAIGCGGLALTVLALIPIALIVIGSLGIRGIIPGRTAGWTIFGLSAPLGLSGLGLVTPILGILAGTGTISVMAPAIFAIIVGSLSLIVLTVGVCLMGSHALNGRNFSRY